MVYHIDSCFMYTGRHTYCGCEPECATLARYGLWPSSSKRPETAFTMQLMELCRAVQIEGQISLQKFCAALEGQQDFLLGQKVILGYIVTLP